mgnify:CR=1 FL=1
MSAILAFLDCPLGIYGICFWKAFLHGFVSAGLITCFPDWGWLIRCFLLLGDGTLPILYWLVLALVLHIVSRHTPFGRRIYAIGSNERTARLSGIHVERVKTWIYILMGALVAVTAVIQVARIGSMDYANAGSGYEMDAIAAVIVGGTSMSGGKGSIVGTVLGMLIIGVMNNLLTLFGVPPFLREACKGVIVIVAVLLQKKEADA